MGKKVEAGKATQTHKVYPRCGLHRKYKGIQPPGTNCRVCKEIYEMRGGGKSD